MSAPVVRHLLIRGRVQGVGYRAFVEYEATRRRLEGWVRNCRDGSVEAVFAGDGAAVEAMIEACWQGPPGARVDGIDQRDSSAEDLALRYTGEAFSVLATV